MKRTEILQSVYEGLAKGQGAWKKEMTAKGAVNFKRDQHGGGAVDRIVAYDKDGKVVGGFNRKGVAEGSEDREQNRLWQMINDYEQRAKATKNDIKKQHYLQMARELRSKLKTSDEQSVAEGKEEKVKKLKKDYDDAVYWSKNEITPQKREAARQRAEKIKRHLDTQYKGVSEADKHSFIGRIQRHNELKKKVDSTWKDAVDAEKRGDKKGADRSFNKHVRYANLERPGTWRDVKEREEGIDEELGYDQVDAKSASYILRQLDQGVSLSDVMDDFPELSRMIDVIAGEHGLHPDDDFEEIEDVLRNDLEDIAAEDDDFGDYDPDEEVEETSINAKVTDFKPGQTATITAPTGQPGVTDTKTIDLKQNPTALTKDPQTGKLKLTLDPNKPAASTTPQQDTPKAGDDVEISDLKKLSGL